MVTGVHRPLRLSRLSCFITGGAGFIGSHAASALAGCRSLSLLDNAAYGSWSNVRLSPSRYKRIRADLRDLSLREMLHMLRGVDVLLHLAAEKHNNAFKDPSRVLDVNVGSTMRLFEAAGRAGVKTIVFTSSLYAYGRLSGRVMKERDEPRPATVYGVSKLAGEGLLREAAARFGLRYRILRVFFVYGPRQYAGTGYPSVIVRNFSRILGGRRPVIFGDGEQVLDYVYVDDVVDAILRAIDLPQTGPEVINVGSGRGTSISRLTDLMLHVSKSRLAPTHGPADWTAGTRRVADTSLAHTELGWKANTPLRAGLNVVWEWLKITK